MKPLFQNIIRITFSKWLLVGVFVLLCFSVAIPSAAQTDMAQVRLGHFVFGAPSVNLYVDGKAIVDPNNLPSAFGSMVLQGQYRDLAPGVHTFAAVPDGSDLKAALTPNETFSVKAGHRYMLALLGNVAPGDIHFRLIDETEVIGQNDIKTSAVSVFINNIYGTPALDFYFNDKLFINSLAYGNYAIYQDPVEGKGSKITAHGDPTSVLFEYADAVGSPADIFAVFVFSGKYPGTMDKDYSLYYVGQYVGQLSFTDGGAIAVGDSLPVNITAMGQREQYTLTLNQNMTLDISQIATDASSGADAYLRILNAAGQSIYENDELNHAAGTFDAGWNNLKLGAGTYTLQAGTFVDSGTGAFTLSVKAAAP